MPYFRYSSCFISGCRLFFSLAPSIFVSNNIKYDSDRFKCDVLSFISVVQNRYKILISLVLEPFHFFLANVPFYLCLMANIFFLSSTCYSQHILIGFSFLFFLFCSCIVKNSNQNRENVANHTIHIRRQFIQQQLHCCYPPWSSQIFT